MAFPTAIPLAQATAFTLGCMVLGSRRIDPERAGVLLAATASVLFLVLLIGSTPPRDLATVGIDPDEVHTILE